MEDLLENFIEHLECNISKKLGEELKRYVADITHNSNLYTDHYDEIEHGVKQIIANFFRNCENKNFLEISQNLYNGYIDYDDRNIIRAVRYFVRVYSKFEEIKLKKFFYKWRINILYTDNNFSDDSNPKSNLKNIQSKDKISINSQINCHRNYAINENIPIALETYNKIEQIKIKNIPQRKRNEKADIFNKLYQDSFKKHDERLLKDEMKKISELDECTFRPKISKNS